ncbi:unnamed protein product [Pleuronectes platessa]|uniref:Uncharacterized protein n=1 Tax=Pleuronectes platessa TaxID=8262 RepID=A0A9N7YND3_PLEPL|nr:unnamed protein product [Pleuronectes platessa]
MLSVHQVLLTCTLSSLHSQLAHMLLAYIWTSSDQCSAVVVESCRTQLEASACSEEEISCLLLQQIQSSTRLQVEATAWVELLLWFLTTWNLQQVSRELLNI